MNESECTIPGLNTAFLEVTSRCSLKCKHCINFRFDGNDMELSAIRSILEKLKCGGIERIKFTGGEPFAREDFPQIVSCCEELGLMYIIYTNGIKMKGDWLHSLKFLQSVRVSFDGVRETHDYVRGDGNFDVVFGNLVSNAVKYPNIHFTVNYTINKINYMQLVEMDTLLTQNNLDVDINIGFVKYAGRAVEDPNLVFSEEDAETVVPVIQRDIMRCNHIGRFSMLSKTYLDHFASKFGCPAGRESIFIAINGDVYPCGMLKGKKEFLCGNIFDDSFHRIIGSNVILSMNSLTGMNSKCAQCSVYQKSCTGGCRGNALNRLNDICGLDHNCIFYRVSKNAYESDGVE